AARRDPDDGEVGACPMVGAQQSAAEPTGRLSKLRQPPLGLAQAAAVQSRQIGGRDIAQHAAGPLTRPCPPCATAPCAAVPPRRQSSPGRRTWPTLSEPALGICTGR